MNTLVTLFINAPSQPTLSPGLWDLQEIHNRMQQFLQLQHRQQQQNTTTNNNTNTTTTTNHNNTATATTNNNDNGSCSVLLEVVPLFDEQERLFEQQFTTIAYGAGSAAV